MRPAHRLLAGLLAAGALLAGCGALLTGCAPSVDPIERLGRKAAQKVSPHASVHALGHPGPEGVKPHLVRTRLPHGEQPREVCGRQERLLRGIWEQGAATGGQEDFP
ncbi:hypothetical protein [Streptomyces sp. AK02-01A]|uniref:hypothetical protein n=1 Tax=Streptomyces sp. AK02-01A TaxID=3028648 RepID=UPI0029A3EC37|nr:hypothetical protein [Streptomyces sp. AK02-01A]MDX3852184.1 hypothetical protein [Streptomyces sp. AK02-01A]